MEITRKNLVTGAAGAAIALAGMSAPIVPPDPLPLDEWQKLVEIYSDKVQGGITVTEFHSLADLNDTIRREIGVTKEEDELMRKVESQSLITKIIE